MRAAATINADCSGFQPFWCLGCCDSFLLLSVVCRCFICSNVLASAGYRRVTVPTVVISIASLSTELSNQRERRSAVPLARVFASAPYARTVWVACLVRFRLDYDCCLRCFVRTRQRLLWTRVFPFLFYVTLYSSPSYWIPSRVAILSYRLLVPMVHFIHDRG